MKSYAVAVLAALAALTSLAGCAQSSAAVGASDRTSDEEIAAADQALTPAGGDPCSGVDADALGDVIDLIESAQDRAALVVAAHPNETHTYLAQTAVDSLGNVHSQYASTRSWLQASTTDNNPAATSSLEGFNVHAGLFAVQYDLEYARRFAMLAAVYLQEDDAYLAYEDISLASELANDLSTRGGRCFMAAYGMPAGN